MIAHGLTHMAQETMNFWKQISHVLKYFRAEEDPKARLPNNFVQGFLEVGDTFPVSKVMMLIQLCRAGTRGIIKAMKTILYISK